MQHRRVGRSGLHVSEIAFGTWIGRTEGAMEEAAREALRLGVTTFDTADAYAATRAEVVLGRALRGVRRESVEICTKVFAPVGPGRNDRGLSGKHVMEARAIEGVTEVVQLLLVGNETHPLRSTFDRGAYVRATAPTAKEALDIAATAAGKISFVLAHSHPAREVV